MSRPIYLGVKKEESFLTWYLNFLRCSIYSLFLCAIGWCLGIWDVEDMEESFSKKDLHAKNKWDVPYFLGDEKWRVHFTLDSYLLPFSPCIFNSSCHQMTLGIISVEEKEESFSGKETTCQKYYGCPTLCVEFLVESIMVWTFSFTHFLLIPRKKSWCINFFQAEEESFCWLTSLNSMQTLWIT